MAERYTISVHNGSTVSLGHNRRDPKIINQEKDRHINPNEVHENWIDEGIRPAYHRIFDEAQKAYNEKQIQRGRPERQIKDYYSHIKDDQKKHVAYEVIVSIGNYDNLPNEEEAKAILKNFVETWPQRNPNLELIGAYYHGDEEGVGHVHCTYIPVARGYKNGLEVQTAADKAFNQMGFKSKGATCTGQMQWQAAQREYLGDLCRAHGWEIEKPLEEKRNHEATELFKARKELERAIDHTNDLDTIIDKQERKIAKLEKALKLGKGDVMEMQDKLEEYQERTRDMESYAKEKQKELETVVSKAEQLEENLQNAVQNGLELEDALRKKCKKPTAHDLERILGTPEKLTVESFAKEQASKALIKSIVGEEKPEQPARARTIDRGISR